MLALVKIYQIHSGPPGFGMLTGSSSESKLMCNATIELEDKGPAGGSGLAKAKMMKVKLWEFIMS